MDIWTRKNIETKFKVKKDMKKMSNILKTSVMVPRWSRLRSRIDSMNSQLWSVVAPMLFVAFGLLGVNEEMWAGRTHTGQTAVTAGKGTATVKIHYRKYLTDAWDKRTGNEASTTGSSLVSATYERGNTQDGSIAFYATNTVDGYTFSGWYSDANCTSFLSSDNPYIAEGKNTSSSGVTKTAYAKFTPTDVTFDPNGGSVAPTTKTVTDNAAYGTLPVPTRANYTFLNWYTGASDGTVVTASTTVTNKANHTLYAHWTPNYTITLTAGSGTTSAGTTSITVALNLNNNLTDAITTPTKSGNVFDGYYTGINGTGTQIIDAFGNIIAQAGGDNTYTDASKNWKYANNIELFANWIAKYDFEITGSNYTINNDSWNQATAFNFVHADEDHMTTTIEKKDVISYNRGTNTITALKIGTSKITFTQNTSSTVNNGTIEFTITVDSVANTLAVSNTEFTRYVEQDIANVRSGKNSDGTITTTSSNPNLAYYDIEDNTIYIPNTDAQTLPFSDVIITISQAATAKYKYKKHTITLTVQKYPNALKCAWNNGVAGDDWDENMNFDSKLPVKFSSSNTSGPAISVTQSPASAVATFKNGAGGANPDTIITNHREGTVTWTVSQAEDYKYVGDEITCSVIVGTDPSPGCTIKLYDGDNTERKCSEFGDSRAFWSPAGKAVKLYFEAERTTLLSKSITPYEYVNGEWKTYDGWAVGGSLDRNNFKTFDRDLSANATAVKFSASNDDDVRVRKVYVTGVSYFNIDTIGGGAITTLNMPVNTKGGNVTRAKFCVDYGTCADNIKLASDHPRIKFAASSSTTHSFSTGANHHGRDTIELTYTSPADEGEDITATITIYTPYDHKTLTVKAISKGKLSTTLEYKGADSYSVDHANMNSTELFQVRDENGDLVASPAIMLSSNATSIINTASGNTAIDFLCGGSATITASYAGDATYAAATNNGISMPITVNKLADAITWSAAVQSDTLRVTADRDLPYSLASANTTATKPITFTSSNASILRVIAGETSDELHTMKHDTVRLTATTTADCTYSSVSSTIVVIVLACDHRIVWNQKLAGLSTKEDGTINDTIKLTAYAVDSSNVATGKAITYSFAEAVDFVRIKDDSLFITGTGHVVIAAKTAVDNKYEVASASKQLRVRVYGAACGTEVVDVTEDGEKHCMSGYTNQSGFYYNIGPSDTIRVKIGRETRITCGKLYIHGYSEEEKGGTETKIAEYDPSDLTNDGTDYVIPIDTSYRSIKFQAIGKTGADPRSGGTQYKWISNLHILQKSYLYANKTTISHDRLHVYDEVRDTITIRYSDKPLLQYRFTGRTKLTCVPIDEIDNDCGDFGSYRFVLNGTFKTTGGYKDTLFITTTACDTLRIPMEFRVSIGNELYFQTEAGDWNTETKWTNESGVVQNMIPEQDCKVVIGQAVTITGQVAAYQVMILGGGSVTIAPNGGLTVGAGGISGATASNLILKAGTEGVTKGQTGYLRISPDYKATMPNATVEFFGTVHYDTSLKGDNAATYQCVGAPVEGVLAKTVFTPGSYLYTWDEEQDGWVSSRTKLTFEAFKGFEVTQKKEAAGLGFEYAGQLISVSDVKTIDLDYSDAVKGYNLLANSFTAPIDIAQFRAGDFINANQTIYILNAGTKANSDDPEADIDAPGKWIGMPIATVAELAASGYPRMIAPLQGFWIKATGASPQLKLDYSRLVWGVDYSEDRANKPLRAPKRDAEMDEEMPITGKLQVSLYSETERDFFFMLESERYDAAYENGYDAPKIPSGSMDVFTVEGENELGVDATNSIIGTRVGVRTGGESVYTFVFSHLSGEHEWALYDHETGDKTDINEGTEYMFFAEPYSLLNGRFEIVERAEAPSVTTGVDGADNEVKAYKFIKDNQMYILKNGVLYNVMGGVVR